MAYSEDALYIEEVAEAVAINTKDSHFHFEDRFFENSSVMAICPGLITTDKVGDGSGDRYQHKVRFVHSSIKDYLTGGTTRVGRAAEIPSEAEAHARIAEMCLIYLLDIPPFKKGTKGTSIKREFPLVDYATDRWKYHARMSRPADDRIDRMALALLRPQIAPEIFNQYTRSGWSKNKTNPLLDASLAGLTRVVEQLLIQGAGIHQPDAFAEASSDALCEASRLGYLAILQLLLDYGAPVNYKVPRPNKTPLQIAAQFRHFDCIRLLVANGAAVNDDINNSCGSALHQALCGGADESVITFLLDHGADLSYHYDGLGALDYAVIFSSTNVVKLLLDKGTKINAGVLSFVRDPTTAQLLIDHGADVNFVREDVNGDSILRWAEGKGYDGVAEVLRTNGAVLDMNLKLNWFKRMRMRMERKVNLKAFDEV